MKFIILSMLFITYSVLAQSTYSSANQDTETTSKGNSQLQTGYINEDLENEEIEFSGEVNDSKTLPKEHKDLKGMETDQNPGQVDN